MHIRNRHSAQEHPRDEISQTESETLLRNQPINPNIQQTSTHVPIQDFNEYIRQWEEAYQIMEARNKQLEEEKVKIEALRNEDAKMLQQEIKKVSNLGAELRKLFHVNKQWSEAYRQLQVCLQNQG